MTIISSATIGGTAIPTASGAVSLEKLLLWACMAYFRLFKDNTYQSEQFVERLSFCQKALYRRTDESQDILVFTVHIPMNSAALSGGVDWDTDTTAQGRWMYAMQPTKDTSLTIPTSFNVIKS